MSQNKLTPQEVARRLRVDIRTVYAWLRTGKLKGRKYGGSWRIERGEIE